MSLCTGSHNNASFLGASENAKGAVFYICPYLGKIKFPLQHSLSILNETMLHVEKFPSKADDSGSLQRSTKHVLQRVLNKLMMKMELSDFQVTADLLGLPSIIRSEPYSYLDVNACMSLQTLVDCNEKCHARFEKLLDKLNRREEEEGEESDSDDMISCDEVSDSDSDYSDSGDNDSSDTSQENASDKYNQRRNKPLQQNDLLKTIGRLRLFTYEAQDDMAKPVKELVPVVSYYTHRGEALKYLNRDEYYSLVKVEKKVDSRVGKDSSARSRQFPFCDSFGPSCQYAQVLEAKQRTLIVTSKGPTHPGKEQEKHQIGYALWKKRADTYARFVLTLFRAEIDNYDGKEKNTLGYSWADLRAWIDSLQSDDSIISKFRIMAMHTRMKGLYTTYSTKVMLSKYRGRNRALWSEAEKNKMKHDHAMRIREDELNNEFDFRSENSLLEPRVLAALNKQSLYDKEQTTQYKVTCSKQFLPWDHQITEKVLCDKDVEEVQLCGKEIRDGPSSNEIELIKATNKTKPSKNTFNPDVLPQPQIFSLNEQQDEFAKVYLDYLENVNDPKTKPPPVTLLHGCAGTGKSAVIKAILRKADSNGLKILKTSFNAINAVAIQGKTASSLFSIGHKHANFNEALSNRAYHNLKQEAEGAVLIVLDEVSTIAPHVLSRISNTLCQIFQCDDPFGGLPIVLVGDLSQMAPVKAKTLTESLIDVTAVKKNERTASRESKKKKNDEATMRSVLLPETNGVTYAENRYNSDHPYTKGSNLFSTAKWFELTKSERSLDEEHTKLIEKIYKEGSVKRDDLSRYKHLSEDDFSDPDSPWLTASIIVSTNRERYTLTHEAAVRYAAAKGKIVYRWLTNFSKWEGAPADISNSVYDDPCFYEYFVAGASAFITDRVCAETNLVNGIPCSYHSFVPGNEYDKELVLNGLASRMPGEVVTLSEPPLCLNVEIFPFTKDKDLFTDFHRDYFKLKSLCGDKTIVIPILQGTNKQTEKVLVHGGPTYACSQMTVKNNFPLELAFAITVNKAQGRTIDHVILAISKKPVAVCNMGLKELYVALSRVRHTSSIRLLVTGDDPIKKWFALAYIDVLKVDPTVAAFFAGYNYDSSVNWKQKNWNADLAYQYYKDVKQPSQS